MSSILSPRPDDRPPKHEEWGVGASLSLAVHLALVGALAWSVHWHSSSEPEGVTAELWSAVPQAAAPAPTAPPEEVPPPPAPTPPRPVPAPPPPPPVAVQKAPDIVTERLEKQLREKERQREEQEKAAKAKADAKLKADQQKTDADKQKLAAQQKLDAQKLAKLHDENVRRMMGQMDAPANATGTAARSSGPSASYAGKIAGLIHSHLVYTDSLDGIKSPEILIRVGVDGTILSQQITHSSGNPAYDAAVLRAVEATRTLPRDVDGRIPPSMLLVFNPAS